MQGDGKLILFLLFKTGKALFFETSIGKEANVAWPANNHDLQIIEILYEVHPRKGTVYCSGFPAKWDMILNYNDCEF